MVYGYVRVSTAHQSLERQEENIKSVYPSAVIFKDKHTGRGSGDQIKRPEWDILMTKVKSGDLIVFDEVSRMSRSASEGMAAYEDLFRRGVDLVFLKERHMDTANYRRALQADELGLTGNEAIDAILEGVRKALMCLARDQVKASFQRAEDQATLGNKAIREGIERRRARGERIGRPPGKVIETRKANKCKQQIARHSRAFGGSLTDRELIEWLHIDARTYYKYKREVRETEAIKEQIRKERSL